MTETEYIQVGNRVKISAALNILRDVLPGTDYGISPSELTGITQPLALAEIKLFESIETQEG